jgi:hypothetical protein
MPSRPLEKAAPLSAEPPVDVAEAIREHTSAMESVAQAMQSIADAVREATTQREPADAFYAQASERLTKLCAWLSGKWPWIIGLVATIGVRAIQIAPDQAPKVIAEIIRALTGAK